MKKSAVKVDQEAKNVKVLIIVSTTGMREEVITITTQVVDRITTERDSILHDMKAALVTTMIIIEDPIITIIPVRGQVPKDTVVINDVIHDFNLIKYGN
jgi:hypothetical protein